MSKTYLNLPAVNAALLIARRGLETSKSTDREQAAGFERVIFDEHHGTELTVRFWKLEYLGQRASRSITTATLKKMRDVAAITETLVATEIDEERYSKLENRMEGFCV